MSPGAKPVAAHRCPLCRSEQHLTLDSLAEVPSARRFGICATCGLIFRLDAAKLPPWPSREKPTWLTESGSVDPMKLRRAVEADERMALWRYGILANYWKAQDMRPGTALELRCGFGAFARLLRAAGWQMTCLEADPHHASVAAEYFGLAVDSLDASWQPESEPADLVIACDVMSRVHDPVAFATLLSKSLHPRGLLFVDDLSSDFVGASNLRGHFGGHRRSCFSPNTLRRLFGLAGLRVVASGFVEQRQWSIAAPSLERVDDRSWWSWSAPEATLAALESALRAYRIQHPQTPGGTAGVGMSKPAPSHAAFAPSVSRSAGARHILHIGVPFLTNAGDVVLYEAVRWAFLALREGLLFNSHSAHAPVTEGLLRDISSRAMGVVVGGGGLLLRDTAPNAVSGWQWNCSLDALRRIARPLAIFAIGYNRFRGQEDFDPVFREHLAETVRRSVFFGLRNTGSIRAVSTYLPPELAARLTYQPCPTTVLRYLKPRPEEWEPPVTSRILGVNVAFDRGKLRFGGAEHQRLSALASALRQLQDEGWLCRLLIHVQADEAFGAWLDGAGVRFESVNLAGVPPEQVLAAYREIPITLGMRGHAQMIPFGLGQAIVSLVSHDKLRWFLEDLGHTEWGVEMDSPNLTQEVVAAVRDYDENRETRHEQVRAATERLWHITRANVEKILAAFEGS